MFNRENVFISAIRAFPDSIKLVSLLNFIGAPSKVNLFYLLLFLSGSLTNFTLKFIFKSIYKGFKVKQIPLLGIGDRPKGASSCSTFLTFDNKLSTTFGMPSGHSQMAWIFSSFYIFKTLGLFKKNNNETGNETENGTHKNDCGKYSSIYDKKNNSLKITINIIQILLLLTFALFMSYSRVYIEKCHTIQQVIIGAITGSLIGLLGIYIYRLI